LGLRAAGGSPALARWLGRPVIGVHGHNIPDSVASFLPLRGIIVATVLDHAFIAALAERSRAA